MIDPTDIKAINDLARSWAGAAPIHRLAIERVVIADHAADALAGEVEQRSGGGRITLVADRTPMTWSAGDLKAGVEDVCARYGPLALEILEDPPGGTCAKLDCATALAERLRGSACVVAVGSGSVTDVTKYARHLVARQGRRVPFICFPTAASVTAYTSSLAVLTVAGVKRTLPAAPPEAVVCDLGAIAAAPPAMTRAGFGDVLARSVSYGDWVMANQLGMTSGYSTVPGRLLEQAERDMIAAADTVLEPHGVRRVLDGVLLAGMAMSLVDQTAPLSGWEHVISHYLDLRATAAGRAPALHGAQVGVGTLMAARAYAIGWPRLDVERLLTAADPAAVRARVEAVFGHLPVDPGLVAEVWRDQEDKTARWNAGGVQRARFVEAYRRGTLEALISTHVRPAVEVEAALRRAGAPRAFADLDPPVDEATARDALLGAHLIRKRLTLGDVLDHGGWLDVETAHALMYNPAL